MQLFGLELVGLVLLFGLVLRLQFGSGWVLFVPESFVLSEFFVSELFGSQELFVLVLLFGSQLCCARTVWVGAVGAVAL